MNIVLDASVAVAWLVTRNDPSEAALAQQVLQIVMANGASVPWLWSTEVANAILTAERRRVSNLQSTSFFLADLDLLPISVDNASGRSIRDRVLSLGRTHQLSAYDATYLELAQRQSATLATFDRQLAEACRAAKVPVFSDQP